MSQLSPGVAFGAQLVNDLSPLKVARTMEAFGRVRQQNQQREIFSQLQRQHFQDVQRDPEYRRYFNTLAKRNPNALMDARNLSQMRAMVGAVRENLKMVDELEQRIDAFGASQQGQAIGFNPEFKKQELKRIAKLIQENPEAGNQALFQEMGILSAAMQNAQTEQQVQGFFLGTRGQSAAQQLATLDETPLPFAVKQRIQSFLLQRNTAAQRGLPEAPEPEGMRDLRARAASVQTDAQLNEVTGLVAQGLASGAVPPKEGSKILDEARQSLDSSLKQEARVQEARVDAAAVDAFFQTLSDEGVNTQDPIAIVQAIEDDDDLQAQMKRMGIENTAEFGVQIADQNTVLGQRLAQAQGAQVVNLDLLKQFTDGGGQDKFEGKQIVTPSDTPGKLNIPTDSQSPIPVYRRVPPMRTLEPGVIFDDKGLPGAGDIGLLTINGIAVPAMSAIAVEGVPEGTQIGFSFADVAAQPNFFSIPIEGNRLNVREIAEFDLADYAKKVMLQLDQATDDSGVRLLDGSIKEFSRALNSTVRREKDPERKRQLRQIVSNVENIKNVLTIATPTSVSAGPGAPGQIVLTRKARDLPADSPERLDAMGIALMRFMIEYNRFNAVMTNSFSGQPQDANP